MRRVLTIAALCAAAAVLPARGQFHGVPPSVTSIGTPGRSVVLPSVTSFGFPVGRPIHGNVFFRPGPNVFFGPRANTFFRPGFFRRRFISPVVTVPVYGLGYGFDYAYQPAPSQPVVVVVQPQPDPEPQPEADAPEAIRWRGQTYVRDYNPRAVAPLSSPAPETPPAPQPSTVLVMKDGSRLEIENYVLTGGYIYEVQGYRRRKIPLSEVNVGATVAANQVRGVEFSVPWPRPE